VRARNDNLLPYVDMINVGLGALDVGDVEAAGLGDLFNQIELGARFGEGGENQQEGVPALRDGSPHGGERDVFGVDEGGTGAGGVIYQEGGSPDADEHVGRGIVVVAMHVHKGVFQRLRVNGRKHFYVDRGLGFNRRFGNGGASGEWLKRVFGVHEHNCTAKLRWVKLELTGATKIFYSQGLIANSFPGRSTSPTSC